MTQSSREATRGTQPFPAHDAATGMLSPAASVWLSGSISRGNAARARAFLVCAYLGSFTAYLLSIARVDPDLWGHVRFGLDIIRLREIPQVDRYSFTSDQFWVNHEWLSETLMGLAYLLGGPVGLTLLKFGILAAAFAVVNRSLRSHGVPAIERALLTLCTALASFSVISTIRPQLFSILLFAIVVSVLSRAKDRFSPMLWCLPLVMAVWVNLHGGWLVGLGTLGLWLASTTIRRDWRAQDRAAHVALGAAVIAATLINPYGIHLWEFLWSTVGLTRADVSEWQPLTVVPRVDRLPWLLTTAFVTTTLTRKPACRRFEIALVLAVLAYVSFRVWRVGAFYSIAAVVLLAPTWFRAHRPAQTRERRATLVATGAVLLAVTLIVSRATIRNLSCVPITESWLDLEGGRFIAESRLSGRLLTWFDWGEYAIWHLGGQLRVSLDGRRETIYSPKVVDGHGRLYRGEPGAEEYLASLKADYAWLPSTLPAVQVLRDAGWTPLYTSPQSVVFARHASSPKAAMRQNVPAGPQCFPGV